MSEDITDRLGNAAYAAYVAAGEDTDGAHDWRELFLPMKFPEWSDSVGAAVARVVADRDDAEDKLAAIEALVKDTDGEWLPGNSFDGLVGEIQAAILRGTV